MTETRAVSQEVSTRELPGGWSWARLGDVIKEAQGGFACGERDPSGVIQLRMNNVTSWGTIDWSSFIRVPANSSTVAAYRLQPGDVLFNNTNSTELVGKTALFKSHMEPIVFSNHFTRLRTIPNKLSPQYLALWVQSQWQQRVFEKICNRWIGQSAVQRDKLLALEIPLPPLPEQQRIVSILSEQMAAVEQARKAARVRLEAAKSLPAAYLRSVFNSPEAQQWPRTRLGEVCEINPRRPDLKRGEDMPTTFVPMSAVQEAGQGIARAEHKPFAEVKKGYTYFADGDVLFAKITPCMQNGKHAIARYLTDGVGFGSTEFHVLRPQSGIISEWVHWFVLQPWVLQEATAHFTGAVGQQRVPEDYLAGLPIPLPPLPEQRRIVSSLSEQMEAVERARKALQEELDTISKLPAALLRRAFAGGL